MKIENMKMVETGYVGYNLPPGIAIAHFKKYNPKKPPEDGYYLVLTKDGKMHVDYLSKFGSSYKIIGYAKFGDRYFNNQFIINEDWQAAIPSI